MGCARDGGLAQLSPPDMIHDPRRQSRQRGDIHSRRGWRPVQAAAMTMAVASAGGSHDYSTAGRWPCHGQLWGSSGQAGEGDRRRNGRWPHLQRRGGGKACSDGGGYGSSGGH